MKRRKLLLSSSTVLASASFLTGTGAFSSTEADRNLNVETASDEDAYLALTTDDGEPTVGLLSAEGPFQAPQEITIANQLTESLTVTVDSDDDIDIDPDEFDIGVGDEQDVEIDFLGPEQIEADLDIEATGDSVSISATRSLELKPRDIDADVQLGSITAAIQIKDPDNVDTGSVVVVIGDQEFSTTTRGSDESGSDELQIANPSHIDCESKEKVTLTVEGRTNDGIQFSGKTKANCSEGSGGGGGNSDSTPASDE